MNNKESFKTKYDAWRHGFDNAIGLAFGALDDEEDREAIDKICTLYDELKEEGFFKAVQKDIEHKNKEQPLETKEQAFERMMKDLGCTFVDGKKAN